MRRDELGKYYFPEGGSESGTSKERVDSKTNDVV